MGKRSWSVALAIALVAGALFALPAQAQQVPVVPAEPNIIDPAADANGHSSITGTGGGAYIGAADYLAIWFTNDAENLYLHIHTSSPSFSRGSIWYSVYVDPGVGADCVEFRGYTAHDLVTASGRFILSGDCGSGTETVEFVTQDGPEIDGAVSGIHTLTVPRSLSEHLADGKTLSVPNALDRYYLGTDTTGGLGVGILDDTEEGTPYVIGGPSSGSKETVGEEPPGKNDPPGKGKKKGCKKGKGKKKGACPKKPKPPAGSCAPYQPGEMGMEAETTVVTDAATEDEPIEIDVPLGPATSNVGSDRTTRMKHNVQVDSEKPEAGLWIRLESPPLDDPDLYVYWPEGGEPAAVAGGFNPLLAGGPLPNPTNHAVINGLNGVGRGGHSEFTAEAIDGLKTSDCQGWTLDLVNWAGRGGYTLKLWLGDAENDPAAPGTAAAATTSFYNLLMSF